MITPRVVCPTTGPALVLLPLLLAGCTTPYRQALPPDSAGSIAQATAVVALQQHEIETSINPSNLTAMAGGGLIWALVDAAANSHSAKKNENFAADLRQALLDYKFEDVAVEALTARLGESGPVHLATVSAALDTPPADLPRVVAEAAPGDAVAIVQARYLFNPPFTRVVVAADVWICAQSEPLRAVAKMVSVGKQQVPVLYRNRFQSAWSLPSELNPAMSRREDMVAAWSTDQAAPVRQALTAACAEVAAMLAWDLAQPGEEKYSQPGARRVTVLSYQGRAALALGGTLAQTENDRDWIRIFDGPLYAEPR